MIDLSALIFPIVLCVLGAMGVGTLVLLLTVWIAKAFDNLNYQLKHIHDNN